MQRATLWNTWVNAEIYREFVDHFPIYRALNERIVELAELDEARRVLDLGCGTGATTTACLARLPAEAEVAAVDAAETMLETARGSVHDPRARFLHADASSIEDVVEGRFDRAVCNAAFWLFRDPAAVLEALRRRVSAGGLFVFNAPVELLAGERVERVERVEPEPFQISLAHAVCERTGIAPPPPRRLDAEWVRRELSRHGFRVRDVYPFRYHGRQGELMELMRVPALAIQLAPELGYDACLDIVRQASESNDPALPVEVPWAFFVATRCES